MRYALDAPNESLCSELAERTAGNTQVLAACRLAGSVWDGVVTRARGPRAALDLLEIGADIETVQACVLADPRLQGKMDQEQLRRDYGEVVAGQVAQMQRLLQLGEQYRRDQQADWYENLRRLLLSAISDVRVMLIQLVHRLERLRGLVFEPDQAKRRAIAAETLDVYAPIAHRLGLGQIKWELEDLAFRHLEPGIYKRIAHLLDERRTEREAYLQRVRTTLESALAEAGIKARVYGRPKHIYSIWGKMQRKKLSFDGLFDVRALRVEVDKVVEIQIRTPAMHEQAELGVAAHWRYKEGGGHQEDPFAAELNRLRQALAAGGTAQPRVEDVYVFTPQGDIIALPLGSTVLDYAYRVHTLVGHRCRGAKINGQIVPIKTLLHQADQVEILTQPTPAPSREWGSAQAGFLHSASARAKVRNWFHRLDQTTAREAGAVYCDRLFRRLGLNRQAQSKLMSTLKFKSLDALYEAVGNHKLDANSLLNAARAVIKPPEQEQKPAQQLKNTSRSGAAKSPEDAVLSLDGMKAQPAGCCQPRPGDPVLAFITRGQGLKLHNQDCANIRHLQAEFPERILAVEWPSQPTHWAQVLKLDFLLEDVARFWADLGPVLAPFKARVVESRSRLERNSGLTDLAVTFELPAAGDVFWLIKRLQALPAVESVQRV
ncbi:MAG: hypothetical protein B7X44_09795 [Halothiobacillus sp. 15-55-196]|uniref:RelA/SpoT family protein n=1 Tax=Halothiobacillus sp. 15-55-196 TaxID=1970382 RepID=UPI000BC9C359|nr:HD domain-containing protein [Halothiobacillus sp. 15-55-196]OZB35478.1 MAG: hypothetical protein B7X44_09795 [Halothiobacillus sp. 15-55-196]